MNQDVEHLRLLSLFHYIAAGLSALFSLFAGIYIVMGLTIVSGRLPGPPPSPHSAGPPPEFMGWFLVAFGVAFMLIVLLGAGLNVAVGRCLATRRARTFCFVVAGINCLNMPLGTLLGIFTIVVLSRPSVKLIFEGAPTYV